MPDSSELKNANEPSQEDCTRQGQRLRCSTVWPGAATSERGELLCDFTRPSGKPIRLPHWLLPSIVSVRSDA